MPSRQERSDGPQRWTRLRGSLDGIARTWIAVQFERVSNSIDLVRLTMLTGTQVLSCEPHLSGQRERQQTNLIDTKCKVLGRIPDSTAAGIPIHFKDEAQGICAARFEKTDTSGLRRFHRLIHAIDRLVPKLAAFAIPLITQPIFWQETSF